MSKKQRRSKKRSRFFYVALTIVILAEVAFIAVYFLNGYISRITNPQTALSTNSTIVLEYMLGTLIDPYNNMLYNATGLGLINNTKPFLVYMTINDPNLINYYCSVWPVLYNASTYENYRVIVIVFPEPLSASPSTVYTIQQFENYVYQICNFNIGNTNFIMATAFWNNYTTSSGTILGYEYLLPLFLNYTGINASNVTFPILMGVGARDYVPSNYILYGSSLTNETQMKELINALGSKFSTP